MTLYTNRSDKAPNQDTIELPNINTVSQPVPYEDCQPPPAKTHNYANFAVYDTVSDDDIMSAETTGHLEQRNPAPAADKELAQFSFSKGEQGTGAYCQLNRQ